MPLTAVTGPSSRHVCRMGVQPVPVAGGPVPCAGSLQATGSEISRPAGRLRQPDRQRVDRRLASTACRRRRAGDRSRQPCVPPCRSRFGRRAMRGSRLPCRARLPKAIGQRALLSIRIGLIHASGRRSAKKIEWFFPWRQEALTLGNGRKKALYRRNDQRLCQRVLRVHGDPVERL